MMLNRDNKTVRMVTEGTEQEPNEAPHEEEHQQLSLQEIQFREDLKTYYRDHFNLQILWQVIEQKNFPTREFGFDRLDSGFTRNKSFERSQDLIDYLSLFPVAGVYIGALYEDRVMPAIKYQKGTSIHQTKWLGRELIFDLDMDEYNPVRTCGCEGREVCEDCWTLMQEAADIMDDTLRVDFGFEHLVWVYTGGRGYHCWVLDKHTFDLDQTQRAAIIGHMQLIHDPKGNQRVDSIGDHAVFLKERIYQKIGRNFILDSSLSLLQDEAGFGRVTAKRAKERLEQTAIVREIVESVPNEEQFLKAVIKRHYPRIDHKVTIDTRRLIRMPGSIHASTKNVSEILSTPTKFNPIFDATNLYDVLGKDQSEGDRV